MRLTAFLRYSYAWARAGRDASAANRSERTLHGRQFRSIGSALIFVAMQGTGKARSR